MMVTMTANLVRKMTPLFHLVSLPGRGGGSVPIFVPEQIPLLARQKLTLVLK